MTTDASFRPSQGGKHRWFIWLSAMMLSAVSLALAGWAIHSQERSSTPSAKSGTSPSAKEPEPLVACLGVVDFDGGVLSLHPTVFGRVVEVRATENGSVRSGDVLLRINDEAARAHLTEAEAALEAALAQSVETQKIPKQHQFQVAQQRAALAAAQHDLAAGRLAAARKQDLAQKEQLNRQEAEAAGEQAHKLEAVVTAEQRKLDALLTRDPDQEVKRANADVRAKHALVEQARHALGEHMLRAPSDGTVLRVLTSAGETLSSQSRQPTLLFAPHKPQVVRAEVDQEFASRVAVGQRAEIEDDFVGQGPTWHGRVVRVAEWFAQRRTIMPDTPTFQDVRTMECTVQIDLGQPPIRLGQRVRVKLFSK
jgi:multidrug resistance efflux pump